MTEIMERTDLSRRSCIGGIGGIGGIGVTVGGLVVASSPVQRQEAAKRRQAR